MLIKCEYHMIISSNVQRHEFVDKVVIIASYFLSPSFLSWPFGRSNIGLPFYGRSFGGSDITGFGQAFDGSADLTWSEDEGSPQCKFIQNSLIYARWSPFLVESCTPSLLFGT